MLSYLLPEFMKGNIQFLTFKGRDPKHQKIDFVNKLCKRISCTYAIVKEKNKKSEGYHFHCILKIAKPIPKSFFKKGVHMHMKPVTKFNRKNTVQYTFSGRDIYDASCSGEVKEMIQEKVEEITDKALGSTTYQTDVRRVLSYMSKDMEFPIQYVDYIISIRSKNTAIPS